MTTEIVRAQWLHDQVFLLHDHAGYPVLMTQPDGVLGADLLPMSIIGCALWDIVSILLKQRQQITSVSATASSSRDAEPPWRFRSIHLHYRIGGTALDPAQVQRAIRLSEEKYCSTFATVRDALPLTSDFEISDAIEPQPVATPPPSAAESTALDTVLRFHAALNARQLDTMLSLLTEDTVFENTVPPPDGTRYEGMAAVRGFWKEFFEASSSSRFDIEEIFAVGDRVVMRWVYHWASLDETAGHIRGVDIYRVTDGLIAEKLSYVKG
jgi:uncharacterized OsmC-like protein/ketosteroid isomerase-like protein